ncbi:hypothetical protein F3Y22_tig00111095pilonHSYRG01017 [Hibiscus syriacus]|uniref:ZCF37 n=1 Tax=Hibiscus syriacus TaxID=106335 RepID=A0A6A2Z1G0_HIBSY|nr:uncharacterized protein LOC120152890 [Hibiscus syriacus]KAE8685741.1 hypothetical protein F3Y22_tig00111095pilonHSYRG01017 [Hibiscus syriacus]
MHFQMLQPFFCGAFDPGRKKPRGNSFPKKEKKNPYSDHGLDKFSELLAKLEEKKQKIYSQTGSQDISLVRFRFKNSTDIVPIVVKLKDKKEDGNNKSLDRDTTNDHHPVNKVVDSENSVEGKQVIKKIPLGLKSFTDQKKKEESFSWNLELHQWRRPSYYVPTIIVSILLLLLFFGRSVSTLFTSIAVYTAPAIHGKSYSKKKVHARRLSGNK